MLQAIEGSTVPEEIKQTLVVTLSKIHRPADSGTFSEDLRRLTGLAPTKALRALCILFGVPSAQTAKWALPSVTPETVEAFVRSHHNPFDLLTTEVPASVLDLGSGDLSFAEELAACYEPRLMAQDRPLILHCLDRLDPNSRLGGPLHAEPHRLHGLRSRPGVKFRFYGDQDMFELEGLVRDQRLAAQYLIVTCWAPATPTFAYEPTRLSPETLVEELRRTKGESRQIAHGKEAALEVLHGGKSLLFPSWKFDIRGPLALLELMASRGALCVLGGVDSQVFWEILSQLVDDPNVRPADVLLSDETIPKLFGDVYDRLAALPEGAECSLSDFTTLRRIFPSVLSTTTSSAVDGYRFRQVTIRRGAIFEGVPASSTARRFQYMKEETPPWFLTLVPELTCPGKTAEA